jgi:hypothetical protein
MQEAEIRRITVPGQPKAKKKAQGRKILSMVVCTCHPSDGGKPKIEGSQSRLA